MEHTSIDNKLPRFLLILVDVAENGRILLVIICQMSWILYTRSKLTSTTSREESWYLFWQWGMKVWAKVRCDMQVTQLPQNFTHNPSLLLLLSKSSFTHLPHLLSHISLTMQTKVLKENWGVICMPQILSLLWKSLMIVMLAVVAGAILCRTPGSLWTPSYFSWLTPSSVFRCLHKAVSEWKHIFTSKRARGWHISACLWLWCSCGRYCWTNQDRGGE